MQFMKNTDLKKCFGETNPRSLIEKYRDTIDQCRSLIYLMIEKPAHVPPSAVFVDKHALTETPRFIQMS